MAKEPAKRGQPTKYDEKFHPLLAYNMALRGLTDEQMAKEMDIAESTFHLWKTKHSDFSESLKRGKEEPDSKVEGTLYQKALGFYQSVRKPMVVSLGSGMGSEIQYAEFDEYIPPSDTAIIFTLKNRRPDKWRDKQEIEHSGGLDMTTMSQEEFDRRAAEILAAFAKTQKDGG